jgi:hypothetical protein
MKGRCVDYFLFLNRRVAGPPRLLPFSKDIAVQWFEQIICDGLTEIHESHKIALRNLLSARIVELSCHDLDSGTELLENMVRRGGGPAKLSTVPEGRLHA